MKGAAIWTAALLAALLIGPAQPAHAADQRPCVSKREYYAVNGFTPQTRPYIEERWDVTGRGVRVAKHEARKTYVIRYVACGYDLGEGQVLVRYRKRDGQALQAERWIRPGAEPHDHPRPLA